MNGQPKSDDRRQSSRAGHPRSWLLAPLAIVVITALMSAASHPGLTETASAQEPSPPGGRDLIQAHDNTNFPLVGKHRTTECSDCHLQGLMAGTPVPCEECHWVRKQDDRYQLALGIHCEECHTPQSWKSVIGGSWDHELATGFRLEGAHRAADCAQCHGANGFAGTSSSCSTCHFQDHQEAKEPDHVAAGFPTECEVCHFSQSTWVGALQFEHSIFPLTGKHQTAECSECHVGGVFLGTSTACSNCHLEDYLSTTNPNHQQAQFPTGCDNCHSSSANTWLGATTLDEHSSFPLTGSHRSADCNDCHASGRYAGLPSRCLSCHQDDYDRTSHAQQGFSTDCELCHGDSAISWQGATFEHTGFPLKGSHRSADCEACHTGDRYAGLPSQCVSCHQDDYDRTSHAQQGFSTDCGLCHGDSAISWQGATFEHTRFPLKGSHRSADCNACHASGRYAGLPSQCEDCHLDDYNRTNHRQVGFSTDCEICHGDSATTWQGATFDHNRVFPLEGAHTRLDCQACHSRGTPPTDCYGCHATDYQAAKNPDHVAARFPSSCEQCHFPSHTQWSQAVFDHGFPITSGPHRLECTECHITSNFNEFSCTHCHEHEKGRMDDKHKEEAGYVYESRACYGCHPNGRGED